MCRLFRRNKQQNTPRADWREQQPFPENSEGGVYSSNTHYPLGAQPGGTTVPLASNLTSVAFTDEDLTTQPPEGPLTGLAESPASTPEWDSFPEQVPSDEAEVPLNIYLAPLRAGDEAAIIEPKPNSPSYGVIGTVPDTIIDGWSSQRFGVRLASVRGASHKFCGIPRQDTARVTLTDDGRYVVAAVADGVSSAQFSHKAAQLATSYAISWVLQKEANPEFALEKIDWISLVQGISFQLNEIEKQSASEATNANGQVNPRSKLKFATTLLVTVCEAMDDGTLRVAGVSVGDSPAFEVSPEGITMLSGQKAMDGSMATSRVAALPVMPDKADRFLASIAPGCALLLTSDGVSDALGGGGGILTQCFKNALLGPTIEKANILEFARLVDFSKATYDDDRTAVAIWAVDQ